jgi:hypothetical protein
MKGRDSFIAEQTGTRELKAILQEAFYRATDSLNEQYKRRVVPKLAETVLSDGINKRYYFLMVCNNSSGT